MAIKVFYVCIATSAFTFVCLVTCGCMLIVVDGNFEEGTTRLLATNYESPFFMTIGVVYLCMSIFACVKFALSIAVIGRPCYTDLSYGIQTSILLNLNGPVACHESNNPATHESTSTESRGDTQLEKSPVVLSLPGPEKPLALPPPSFVIKDATQPSLNDDIQIQEAESNRSMEHFATMKFQEESLTEEESEGNKKWSCLQQAQLNSSGTFHSDSICSTSSKIQRIANSSEESVTVYSNNGIHYRTRPFKGWRERFRTIEDEFIIEITVDGVADPAKIAEERRKALEQEKAKDDDDDDDEGWIYL